MSEQVERELAELRVEVRHQTQLLERVASRLFGDGSEDHPGLIADVDRLKQRDKVRVAVLWGLVSTVFGMVATYVSSFFQK